MYQPLTLESGSSSGSRLAQPLTPLAHDAGKTKSCRSDELKKIKDQVASTNPSGLQFVTIVGMGGIGKTTLAKSIYEDVEISYHFHLRAWITISQDYNLRNVLLSLLQSVEYSVPDNVSELENEDLAHVLHKRLKGMRFLIVFDDVWYAKIWNDFKWIFPNDNNGSRILLTSRLMEVAGFVDPNSSPHCLDCLSDEEGWRLMHTEVFDGKACPSDLVEIGKEIAKKCQGLPLAIMVVAGHLSKIDNKRDCWEDVARRLDSLISRNEDKILDILCLSYNHLPQHLKACFIYMGVFPKSSEIHVSKMIRMWNAVGFLHSEDEAEKCLEDLINRNLIMVKDKKHGTTQTCGIHDLLWDLSLREAQNEGHHIFDQSNFGHYHFSASTRDDMKYIMDLTSTYRYHGDSFVFDFPDTSVCNCFRQLRVLVINQSQDFSSFPEIITTLDGLRYLEVCTSDIPESVSRLFNLKTLIIRSSWKSLCLPREIWFLRHLRHLQVVTKNGFYDARAIVNTWHFSTSHWSNLVPILPDLQTLSSVRFSSLSDQVFSRIPNLKLLQIVDIDGQKHNLFNFLSSLVQLCQLEKLNLYFRNEVIRRKHWCNFFPPSIKELALKGSKLQWEDMNVLAKLPNLEVLELKMYAFEGPIYETIEGFPKLKVLLFEELNLKQWIAEADHYPNLQHLVLRDCYKLKEIPYCFGEIPTLESIELDSGSRSARESLRTIQEEQHSMGNYDLRVCVHMISRKQKLICDQLTRKFQSLTGGNSY